ncbi:hypothetical protein ElyMa_003354400 [Elysia marginata]|uniref:Uncharacterized protein n=1 Tax=Elysia marginata TaxID=1093978 RepID=A0AAV4JH14_9GAST|nr:hypothetical protein ElyMa_003354400 [Elysia marginata]
MGEVAEAAMERERWISCLPTSSPRRNPDDDDDDVGVDDDVDDDDDDDDDVSYHLVYPASLQRLNQLTDTPAKTLITK